MWRNRLRRGGPVLQAFSQYKTFIVFDTETTGLSEDAKIIQFSGIRYAVGEGCSFSEMDTMNVFLNPREPLSAKVSGITGITDSLLSDMPDEGLLAPKIMEWLSGADFWVAYNAAFDYAKLKHMCGRTGLPFPGKKTMDVLPMARDAFLGIADDFTLSSVMQAAFPDKALRFHDALDDVRATALVLGACIESYKEAVIASYSMPMQRKAHLNWASCYVNPRAKSQQRIKLNIDDGIYGDIFWDCRKKCWDHKRNKKAEKLFLETDMANLEQQVLSRYAWRFGAKDMDALGSAWLKEKREREKKGA